MAEIADPSRRPQSCYFKFPRYAGMAAFDSRNGLKELRRTKRRNPQLFEHEQRHQSSQNPEVVEDALSWDADEYHSAIINELDGLQESSPSRLSTEGMKSHLIDPSLPVNRDSLPTSSRTENESGSRPLRQPTYRSISEAQLIMELKEIYAGLVATEKKCMQIIEESNSRATGRFSDKHGKDLLSHHRDLLVEYHDFFLASQHGSASASLKALAYKYAMPRRMWQVGICSTLNLLRRRLPESEATLASFTHLVYTTMNRLERDMPHMSHEWDLIKYNMYEYFAALRADGIDMPMSLIEFWAQQYSHSTRSLKRLVPPIHGFFFGDEELPERDFYRHLTDPADPPGGAAHHEASMPVNITETAQLLMSGWLQYGSRIATSFHAFTHALIFLGLVGATAYAMGPSL